MLLVLLPVFAGLPGSEPAVHDLLPGSAGIGGAARRFPAAAGALRPEAGVLKRPAARRSPDEPLVTQPVLSGPAADNSEIAPRAAVPPGDVEEIGRQRISIDELRRLWQAKEPVTILDVRTERSLEGSDLQARGAIRMPPDHVADQARNLGLNREDWLVAYCA